MDRFSLVPWIWRALRGHSVTFAALFALSILGVSVIGGFRHLLRELGLPWIFLLIIPAVVIAVVARKEKTWLPDPEKRRRWARGLVLGSIAAAMVIAKLTPERPAPARGPVESEPQGRAGVRHR